MSYQGVLLHPIHPQRKSISRGAVEICKTGCSFFIGAKHTRFHFFFLFFPRNVCLVYVSYILRIGCFLASHYVSVIGCTSRLSDQNIKDPNLAELKPTKFIKCYANNSWLMLMVCYPKKPSIPNQPLPKTISTWKKKQKLKAQNHSIPHNFGTQVAHLKPPLLQLKPNRFSHRRTVLCKESTSDCQLMRPIDAKV